MFMCLWKHYCCYLKFFQQGAGMAWAEGQKALISCFFDKFNVKLTSQFLYLGQWLPKSKNNHKYHLKLFHICEQKKYYIVISEHLNSKDTTKISVCTGIWIRMQKIRGCWIYHKLKKCMRFYTYVAFFLNHFRFFSEEPRNPKNQTP